MTATDRLRYIGSALKTLAGRDNDGRVQALVDHVVTTVPAGDPDAAIAAIDEFGRHRSFLMNIGDEKGKLLDAAIRGCSPRCLLELGAFCGYSALRAAQVMPEGARLLSVELDPVRAAAATTVWTHAGVDDRVTAVVGSLDDGTTLDRLRTEFELVPGSVDFVLIDHDMNHYLPDLRRLLEAGLLHRGTVVVADNMRVPGAPKYRAYMREQEGKSWHTTEHRTHLEYFSPLPDLLLESRYLGPPVSAERIREVIGELCPLGPRQVSAADLLTDDLGFNSVQTMELFIALEDEFALPPIGDSEAAEISTVGNVIDLVTRLSAESADSGKAP